MQGEKVYVWHPQGLQIDMLKRILLSVGVQVIPYQAGMQTTDSPLLLFGRENPEWISQLPAESKLIRVESIPDSPAKQWKLLEDVQALLKEKRLEDEKS
jgi:hypothetical protein